jgi:hypothetical protein
MAKISGRPADDDVIMEIEDMLWDGKNNKVSIGELALQIANRLSWKFSLMTHEDFNDLADAISQQSWRLAMLQCGMNVSREQGICLPEEGA